MNAKPIPEFMKEYMERIGEECFLDFQRLSREYHNTKQVFHEKKFPVWIPANGRMAPKVDLEIEMRRIDATFKERSLELGCKHGYEPPSQEYYDMDLSSIQEDGAYQDGISHEDFDLLPEDRRARQAHRAFDAKYPEKMVDRQSNRETIEYFFGDGRNKRKPELVREEPDKVEEKHVEMDVPEKEELTREDRVTRFSISRDDITQIDMGMNGGSPSKDRDDRDMDIDR